jgi:hypothetical protein
VSISSFRPHHEEPVGVRVHQDDVGQMVGDQDRVADVLQDDVEPVAFLPRLVLRRPRPVVLHLQLAEGVAQVGDVAEHRDHAVLTRQRLERHRQHLEQQVGTVEGVHQVQLAGCAAARLDERLRQERAEQQVVDLDGPPPPLTVVRLRIEQMLGATVRQHDVVRRVGQQDGVGQGVEDGHQQVALTDEPFAPATQGLELGGAADRRTAALQDRGGEAARVVDGARLDQQRTHGRARAGQAGERERDEHLEVERSERPAGIRRRLGVVLQQLHQTRVRRGDGIDTGAARRTRSAPDRAGDATLGAREDRGAAEAARTDHGLQCDCTGLAETRCPDEVLVQIRNDTVQTHRLAHHSRSQLEPITLSSTRPADA